MGLLDGLKWLVGRDEPVETRTGDSVTDLLARLQPLSASPWRAFSPREAMGVPAVFKAVSLISNTMGSLTLEAYRAQVKLPPDDTPRMVIRPNPFTRPNVFWRDSAFHLARRGEVWWWTAKRDADGSPISLIPIDPRQINVMENPNNLLRPTIWWQETVMPNDDMTQITYLPDPNNPLRGWGPLQACGAAVSVAVEAQEFAANYFAGNPANTWIRSGVEINAEEAAALKADWMADSSSLPKVTGPVVEDVKDIGVSPESAQLTDARNFQNGEIALMFSMPSTLLNYAVQGSTVTYQNVGQVADDFLRQCLIPHYLDPFEQAFTDLLTRQTVAEFNVDALLRADIRTRYDVYNIGIPLGVIDVDEARAAEGLGPQGSIETRPVPFAAPQAIPSSLPVQFLSELRDLRCPKCNKLAGRVAGGAELKCHRCGTIVVAPIEYRQETQPLNVTIQNLMPTVEQARPSQGMRIIKGERTVTMLPLEDGVTA